MKWGPCRILAQSHFFDASSEVHLRSSLQSLHDVIKVTPFNHNVHHRGLWTEAAYGSLKPPPTRRLRRTYLHLSYSMTFTRLHDTSAGAECCRRSGRSTDAPDWPSLLQSGHIPQPEFSRAKRTTRFSSSVWMR